MAIINRISRLFRADLHAVLDRIEEPDVLLKQAVREMEDNLANDKQRLKLLDNEQIQLLHRHSDLCQTLEQLNDEIDVCFDSEKDDLARSLIKRKLETQRLHKLLERKQEVLTTNITNLQKRINENQTRVAAMQQKLELLSEDNNQTTHDDVWYTPDINVRDDEVEVAFLREKQQRVSS
jgi:phage shock protein A